MDYREKFLSAEISAAAISGQLNGSQGMSGNLVASGGISDIPIHYGTTEHWNSQPDLVGKKSHIYVYSDYAETEIDGEMVVIPNIKIGDGSAFLIDNPFISKSVEDILDLHIDDNSVHISETERDFWNKKVRCFIDPEDNENVIFTTD